MRFVIGLFIALLPPSGAFAPHNVTACDGHAYHPGPATARGRLLTDPNQGCQPWSRDWETTSTFISQAALEAGRQSVKLMYAAYLFEYSEKATVGIHAEAAQAKQTLIENGAVAYREVDEGEGPQGFFGPWYDDGSLTGTPQKIYVLGFAGSNDKKDWSYANAGSWCAKGIDLGRPGRMFGAAAGFVDFYEEVMDGKGGKPGLRQAIDAVADSFANTPVVVVGHSMGGALGALGATMQQCCFAQQALPASSRSGARNTATRPGMCSRDGMTTAAGVVRQAVTLRSFFGQGPTSTAALDTRITPATMDCVCLPMVTSAPSAGSTTMTTCHLCRHATLGGSTSATAATSCSIPSAGCPSTDGPNTKTTPLTPAAYRMRTTHSASTGTD